MLKLFTICYVPVWGDGNSTIITFELLKSPVTAQYFAPMSLQDIDLPSAVRVEGLGTPNIPVTALLSNNRKNITLTFASPLGADQEANITLRLLFE